MVSVFFWFALLFSLAVVLGIVLRLFKLTPLIAYVLVGIGAASLVKRFGLIPEADLNFLASLGGTLLLFMVGLEMNLNEISVLGKKVLLGALAQIVLVGACFWPLLKLLGMGMEASIVMALALALSSTVLVVKAFSETHALDSLPGRLAVGILILQDLVAVGIMVTFSGGGTANWRDLIIRAGVAILAVAFLSWRVLPKLVHRMARSTDELVLFSLAWCLTLAGLMASKMVGLSLEVGGFLAGISLSGTIEHRQIAVKIKPLRDFFLTIFFVTLGVNLTLSTKLLWGGLLLSVLILLLKPILVSLLMKVMGFANRTAFLVGLSLGQVSEFGLVIMGVLLGHQLVKADLVGLMTVVVLVTMALSAFLLNYEKAIYDRFGKYLFIFWKDADQVKPVETWQAQVILFGCHRMGQSILAFLDKRGDKVLIVDFDPVLIEKLKSEGKMAVFGDTADPETYEKIEMKRAELIVSTVKDLNDNLVLLNEVKRRKLNIPVILDAESAQDAKRLYEMGAAYVIFPHFVGGLHLAELIGDGELNHDWTAHRRKQEKLLAKTY